MRLPRRFPNVQILDSLAGGGRAVPFLDTFLETVKMLDKEEKLEAQIAQRMDKLRKLQAEAKAIVQELYSWYFIRLKKKEIPEHIRETVNFLDNFANGVRL
jgi:uncharacterized membrane-anchored protein YjiN (DUF445 family)